MVFRYAQVKMEKWEPKANAPWLGVATFVNGRARNDS